MLCDWRACGYKQSYIRKNTGVGRGREGWDAARHLSVEVATLMNLLSQRWRLSLIPNLRASSGRVGGAGRGGLDRVRGEHSATTLAARSSARSVMLSENERRRIRARQHAAGDAGGGSTDDGTVDEDGGVSRASTPVSTGVRRD